MGPKSDRKLDLLPNTWLHHFQCFFSPCTDGLVGGVKGHQWVRAGCPMCAELPQCLAHHAHQPSPSRLIIRPCPFSFLHSWQQQGQIELCQRLCPDPWPEPVSLLTTAQKLTSQLTLPPHDWDHPSACCWAGQAGGHCCYSQPGASATCQSG